MEMRVFHLETDDSGCAARGDMNARPPRQPHSAEGAFTLRVPAPYTSLPPSEGECSCFLKRAHYSLSGKSASINTSLILTPNRNPESRSLSNQSQKESSTFHITSTISQQLSDSRTCTTFTHSWDDL